MTTQEKVQAYIEANPKRLMTVQRFSHNLLKHYNSLVRYLVQDGLEKGMEIADAQDALQRFAAWGYATDWAAWTERQLTIAFEEDKRPDMRFGFRSMKLKITSQIRDYLNLSHVKNETAYNSGYDANKKVEELDGDLKFDSDEEQERLESMVEKWQYASEGRDDDADFEFQPTEVYLSVLTDKQREALMLRNAGWNQTEIAELMGVRQQVSQEHLAKAYDTLRSTFPELARASRAWDFKNTYQRPDGVGTWHFNAFPYDTFESSHELPQYYTEPGFDCTKMDTWYRHWDTKMNRETYKVTAEDSKKYALSGLNPRIFATDLVTTYITRPAPICQDEKPKDFYWSNATRLFNCLGLGRAISDTTLELIKRLT